MPDEQETRHRALNPQESFIIQAPAGSGKTELLSQRFLKLLATVKAPEEIIAITFTRKAAAEMRHRIVSALTLAAQQKMPHEPHRIITYNLAVTALKRDHEQNWHILENPNRLRILTIDALAGFLCAQIPILAGFGSTLNILDQPIPVYEEAAKQLLNTLIYEEDWKLPIETLLLHLDNQLPRVIELLSRILAKREQWLPHVLRYHQDLDALHAHLENSLQNIADECVQECIASFPEDTKEAFEKLAQKAAFNLLSENITHTLSEFSEKITYSEDHTDLPYWKAIADLLLTKEDGFRKQITKNQGFPPKTPEKKAMELLLEDYSENTFLLDSLRNVRHCPSLNDEKTQREMIDALLQLLPLLYAQLRILFQIQGKIDFVELNLAALRALGTEDDPTELALYLDYQIQHLLIDEFQDTSITQYALLEKLTQAWEPNEGRSLFLVGDPMQSIYRFRDAEVGLFIRAEKYGINRIFLTKLYLAHNYRSDKKIIDWINDNFLRIFPTVTNTTLGAIPYAPSIATQNNSGHGVQLYGLLNQTNEDEAAHIAKLICSIQKQSTHESIAILVRSRHHLLSILPALQAAKIPYQAVALETLAHCPIVQDLLTLTRALLHREDRIAWLGFLRSPLLGLTLSDLHQLTQFSATLTLWQVLNKIDINLLSVHAQTKLPHALSVLQAAFQDQGRKPFEQWVKGICLSLGVEAIVQTLQQKNNAERYFILLSEQGDIQEKLKTTYVEPVKQSTQLSIMTIHKAKGLEFDHVILPGLHNKIRTEKHNLMLWLERPNQYNTIDFVLAPIKHSSTDQDPMYRYLQRIEKQKRDYESARLLYVAITRAKKSLHITACIEDTVKSDTLAYLLEKEFSKNISSRASSEQILANAPIKPLFRLSNEWQPPHRIIQKTSLLSDNPLPKSEDLSKRILGTVIHALLSKNNALDNPSILKRAETLFTQHGFTDTQLTQALDITQIVLVNMRNDPRAQWILSNTHKNIHNEYAITSVLNKKIHHFIIDRTFIDDDTLWIIDYKLSTLEHEEKERYESQLNHYAHAMDVLFDYKIKLGLYFPISCHWIEWTLTQECIL